MRVRTNRARIRDWVPAEPAWLTQVHGTQVVDAATVAKGVEADAAVSRTTGRVCVVMTADCLPVFFCDRAGTVVAVAHAGWRGLLAGVLEATVMRMAVAHEDVIAWLGPAIGPEAFEVGHEVRDAFVAANGLTVSCFVEAGQGKWLADLYELARLRLRGIGVTMMGGGDRCTYREADHFFSYRRDGVTGRMASLIWLADV